MLIMNEAFYKNILFKSYSGNIILNEFKVDKCVADIIILNKNPIVFEIKSEFDNLNRLQNQINNYYKVFSSVAVLTCEKHIKKVFDIIAKEVGIYIISNGKLIEYRSIIQNFSFINTETIFNILRKKERENILNNIFGYLPQCSQVEYFDECLEMFKKIKYKDVLRYFYEILRDRS